MSTVEMDASAAAMISELRTSMRGDVIDASHATYDEARRVWNGMIDRRPAVIARCLDTSDVVAAVQAARRYRPAVSIRGGGHQIAGSALCDGLVIDLSHMKAIEVDPAARVVRAQGGVTWGELDRATQRFGLATPGGEVSTTGIAGFTLGGGMGMLMRAYGMACDNVRSVEIVTADGTIRTASRAENADLFWAVCGGGRGIGVITSFEFELYPLGPEVAFAQVIYPHSDAERILRRWPEVTRALPDAVTPELLLWTVPPDPAFPAELHDQQIVLIIALYAGPAAEGVAMLEPLRHLGTPLVDLSGIVSYVEMQASFDGVFPPGGRYYMKSHFMDELSDSAIATILDWRSRLTTSEALLVLRTLGGAISRGPAAGNAYPHRTARYNFSIDAGWSDPARDAAIVGWARATWDALRPYSTGGVYINFSGFDNETPELRGAIFGAHTDRLAAVRATYDPDDLFAMAARRA